MEMESIGVVDLRRDFIRTVAIIDNRLTLTCTYYMIVNHIICDLIAFRGRIYFPKNLSQAREET